MHQLRSNFQLRYEMPNYSNAPLVRKPTREYFLFLYVPIVSTTQIRVTECRMLREPYRQNEGLSEPGEYNLREIISIEDPQDNGHRSTGRKHLNQSCHYE